MDGLRKNGCSDMIDKEIQWISRDIRIGTPAICVITNSYATIIGGLG
jgi:hypothetical protein